MGITLDYQRADSLTAPYADFSLAEIIDSFKAQGIDGANITYPFKQSILALLDVIDPSAQSVNAVNTVLFKDGMLKGYNTDIYGFYKMMELGLNGTIPQKPLVIGAGGAGGAVIKALDDYGVKQVVLNDLFIDKALALKDSISDVTIDIEPAASCELATVISQCDGVINATPMGMDKYPGMPIAAELLRPDLFIADIVYFPLETELMRTARQLGCRVISGSLMAAFQAAKAFEIFTGQQPDEERMLATLFGATKQRIEC